MRVFSKSKLGVALTASSVLLLLSGCAGSDAPEQAQPDVVLPAECKSLYDAETLNDLQATVPPLNSAGVGISSTQVAGLEDMLEQGDVSLRCTWGSEPEYVIATQLMKVDQAQQQAIVQLLAQDGFVRNSETYPGVFFARSQQSDLVEETDSGDATEDLVVNINLETHYLYEGVWVSSYLNNAIVPGYTESIMSVIWP